MDLQRILESRGIAVGTFRDRLGVSDESVRLWKIGTRRMSTKFVLVAEREFGIPRHELRPDLWEAPPRDGKAA